MSLLSRDCLCSVSLPRGTVRLYVACESDISWSYSFVVVFCAVCSCCCYDCCVLRTYSRPFKELTLSPDSECIDTNQMCILKQDWI